MFSTVALLTIWVGDFLNSPSGTCTAPISSSISIPNGISIDDRRALIETGSEQLFQRVRKIKDVVYSSLLVAMGGLGTISFLLLGDLITLGSPDPALQISLSAFAVVVPLLAASYWNLRIWHAIPDPEPIVNVHRPAEPGDEIKEYAVFSTDLAYMQLLTIIPAAIMTFVGVVSVLWHVFWIASIVFVVAVILSCGFIAWSSVQHFRISYSGRRAEIKAAPLNQDHCSSGARGTHLRSGDQVAELI